MSDAIWVGLISTVGAIITVWIQTGSVRKMNLFTEQLNALKKSVDEVTAIAKKNNDDIAKVANGTRITESYRLEIDLSGAIERGYRTREECRRIQPLFKSYQELGGNGYIEDLYNQFIELSVKEEHHEEH